MIKIRLRRQGAKHRPSYRIVVAHDSHPRNGRSVEELGYYDPLTDPATVRIDIDRARYWMSVGAQPSSDTVTHMLQTSGILTQEGKLVPVPGTLTDPLTRTIAELIRHTDPDTGRSTPKTIEFAGRLATYVQQLSADYPLEPNDTEELDNELLMWIHRFVAREFPERAIQTAEVTLESSSQRAAD